MCGQPFYIKIFFWSHQIKKKAILDKYRMLLGYWGMMSSCLVAVVTFCAYFSRLQAIKRQVVWSRTKRLQSASRHTGLFIPRSEMSAWHRLQDWSDKSYLHFFFRQDIVGSHFKSQALDLECVRQCFGDLVKFLEWTVALWITVFSLNHKLRGEKSL